MWFDRLTANGITIMRLVLNISKISIGVFLYSRGKRSLKRDFAPTRDKPSKIRTGVGFLSKLNCRQLNSHSFK